MTSLEIVWGLLFINALLTLVYGVIAAIRRAGVRALLIMLIMLLCPIVGPLTMGGSYLVQRFFLGNKQVDLEAVSFSHEKKVFVFAPDESEHELVPIEESLLVSSLTDRRKAFLDSIRLNVDKNIALYSLGLENDDSETSHYSASILMEAAAGFQDTLQALAVEYEQNPDDAELTLAYAKATLEYLQSGILAGIERRRYEELYAFLLDSLREKHPEALNADHYARMVSNLLALAELPRAESWAREGVARFPDEEATHLSLMKVYYVMGNAPALWDAVHTLENSYVAMSRTGIAAVRFFTGETDGKVTTQAPPHADESATGEMQ